jgi:carboxymethylenebutenolidase
LNGIGNKVKMMKRMRIVLLLFVCSVASSGLRAQCCAGKEACQKPEATEEFAQLANKDDFRASHLEPKAFQYEGKGEWASYPVKEGAHGRAFKIAPYKTNQWIIVIHEWWGLNDYVKREGERLARDLEMNVLCLDLYDGKVATTRDSASA